MIADLKFAFRMLLKAPAFTVIAVVTLALGIGANSAIFSVVDAVLLRPLPFKNPQQLVALWGHSAQAPEAKFVFSFPDYIDYRDRSRSFSALAVYTRAGAVLNTRDAQELDGLAASAEMFDVLQTPPLLGRAYTPDEAVATAAPVVLLSHSLWQRAFGGDPQIVGQQISLSGKSHTVLGVMPPGWKFPVQDEKIDYITPLEPLVVQSLPRRGANFLTVVGRLKPGVSLQQANAEVKTIAAQLAQEYPDPNQNRSARLLPLHEDLTGNVRPALMVLLGAVAVVLLIACANVANLLLARAAARSREIGIRTALGASRIRIVRQLLAESLMLALLGGAGGLLLAWWSVDLLSAFGPRDVPRLADIRVDLTVTGFTFAIAVLSTLVFGLVPALQVSRANVSESLQQGAKGSTGGAHSQFVRASLVVAQVALSLLLLAGAGLLIKSFQNLRATDPGFQTARLVVADITVPRVRYPEPEQQIRFFRELLPKLRTLPGVEALGGADPLPLSGNSRWSSFNIVGAPPVPQGADSPDASHLTVIPGYFEAMKIPVRRGRTFDERDNETAQQVAIVNETFVRAYLQAGSDPVGQRINLDRPIEPNPPLEIVGVVGDSRHDGIATPARPEIYVPHPQNPGRRVNVVIRTAAENLSGLETAITRAVHEIDKDVFVPRLRPMDEFVAAELAQPRFNMMLLAVFASVAMVLAAIGIYGVIAYNVVQRTREIGIRMALGAQRADMLRMVLRHSLTLVGIGLAIGVVAALVSTRVMRTLLYEVSAVDVTTYLAVTVVLAAAALLASYIPARRATRVDPMVALRYE